jgi:hypothetical protein
MAGGRPAVAMIANLDTTRYPVAARPVTGVIHVSAAHIIVIGRDIDVVVAGLEPLAADPYPLVAAPVPVAVNPVVPIAG